MSSTANPPADAPRLKRSLTLWDLILYGIIVIQPVAPMSVFGVLSDRGRGHVVTTILIAMVAMLFTAISYGRMARAYPSAGSAFTYVGAGNQSRARLRHRLEHGDGLHAQSDHLHDLVQPAGARVRSGRSVLGMGSLLCAGVHAAEYSGSEDFGAGELGAGCGDGRGDRNFLCGGGALHLRTSA